MLFYNKNCSLSNFKFAKNNRCALMESKNHGKTMLIIVFNNLKTDARVLRQINAFKNKFNISVISYGGVELDDVRMIVIDKVKLTIFRRIISATLLLLRVYTPAYWLIYNYRFLKKMFVDLNFDLIISNDIETLPLAFHLNCSDRIIFDASA